MIIAVLGLGEAGGLISAGLVAAGAEVRGYDPRVDPPSGVAQCASDAEACEGAELVLSLNSAAEPSKRWPRGCPAVRPARCGPT
jgi:3-hydroxyisobutyrate dehydrogenase-like beta-hydroxyacid dehydrogenase